MRQQMPNQKLATNLNTESPINTQLRELARLWVDANPESVRRIPALCGEIAELAARPGFTAEIDRDLLRRARLLSTRAETRSAQCLAILSRTGCYSTDGALEVSPCVATSGWEG
jgi:hypothetical protein